MLNNNRWVYTILFFTAAFTFAVGFLFYRSQEEMLREEVESDLAVIAKAKVDGIVRWRRERKGDAGVLMESPYLSQGIREWLSNPTPARTEELRQRLTSLKKHYDYSDVLITNGEGDVVFSLIEQREELLPGERDRVRETIATGGSDFLDIHEGGVVSVPHLGVVAPIAAGGDGENAGAIVLISSGEDFIFPFIEAWPAASETAETLIVRKDGDDALYLNSLRHAEDSSLRLRLPLNKADLPAAKAISGHEGIVLGRDYRGEEVIAYVMRIPDSPWYLVAKEDVAEAFAEWRSRSMLIISLFGVLALASGGGFLFVWQRQKKAHYRELYRAELDRHKIMERHATTLKSIGDGVIITDNEGHIDFLNTVAEELTGWTTGEASGRALEEVFHIINSMNRAIVENPVGKVISEGKIVGLANHTVLISKSGEEFQIADSAAPIRTSEGELQGVVLVFRDVTREYEIRARIRESEERFRGIFERSAVGNFAIDENGNFLMVNTAFCDLIGFTREELEGRALGDFSELENTPRCQWTQLVAGEIDRYTRDRTYSRKDGETIHCIVNVAAVRNEQGEFLLAVGQMLDISKRKRAEEERERLLHAIAQVNETIIITDPRGIVEYVNPAFEKTTRYTQDEVVGKHIDEIQHSHRSTSLTAEIWECVSSGRTWSGRFHNRKKDGTVYLEEASISPVMNNRDEIVNFISVKRDITRETTMEEQLRQAQKMEAIGHLAGGVAHDFNNILHAMMGYCSMLLDTVEKDSEAYEYATELMGGTERASALTRQLLTFSRKEIRQPKDIDLNQSVGAMLKMIGRTIGEQIELTLQLTPEDLPIHADPGQMEQVLLNLCVNARDAMPEGGRLIIETNRIVLDEEYCEHNPWAQPGIFAQLIVTDTGRGMDAITRSHIFEPFFTTKEVGKGTGLGLATVFGIVKQHEGLIHVYSEPGKGTSFKIYIPAIEDAAQTQAHAGMEKPTLGGRETVLLAEDDDAVRAISKRVLTKNGYHVYTASDGYEAIELIDKTGGDIQLAILDVIMPKKSGQEVFDYFRSKYPNGRALFLSGYSVGILDSSVLEMENVMFVPKPFSPNSLLRAVRDALDS